MAAQYVFMVKGRGEFPVDMLRRDQCYPYRTEDAHAILGDATTKEREGVFVSPRPPNIDRWASFGWQVQRTCTV
jgi:hypothetical protein